MQHPDRLDVEFYEISFLNKISLIFLELKDPSISRVEAIKQMVIKFNPNLDAGSFQNQYFSYKPGAPGGCHIARDNMGRRIAH